MKHPTSGGFPVFLVLRDQVDKGQRLGFLARLFGLRAVRPPVFDGFLVLLVASRAHVLGLGRGAGLEDPVGFLAKFVERLRQLALGQLAQPRQVVRTHEQPRMRLRHAIALLGPVGHRKRLGRGRHHHPAHLAPCRLLAVLRRKAITPVVGARLKRFVVSIRVPHEALGRFGPTEILMPGPLDRIGLGLFFMEPDERRRIERRRRPVGRAIADFVRFRLAVGNPQFRRPRRQDQEPRHTEQSQRESRHDWARHRGLLVVSGILGRLRWVRCTRNGPILPATTDGINHECTRIDANKGS